MMLRYPKISIYDLDHARAFTEEGQEVYGRLAVDEEGRVVFVPDNPEGEPGRE